LTKREDSKDSASYRQSISNSHHHANNRKYLELGTHTSPFRPGNPTTQPAKHDSERAIGTTRERRAELTLCWPFLLDVKAEVGCLLLLLLTTAPPRFFLSLVLAPPKGNWERACSCDSMWRMVVAGPSAVAAHQDENEDVSNPNESSSIVFQ